MPVKYKDYYEILGVSRDASQEEIRKAYRRLAKKYHPDVSKDKDADIRYKEINEAHEVLRDPERRSKYDALGADWEQGQDFTPPSGWGGQENMPHMDFGGSWGNFSDFFRTIFGGDVEFGGAADFGGNGGDFFGGASNGRGRAFVRRDREVGLQLSLEDIVNGGTRELVFDSGDGPRTIRVRLPRGIVGGSRIRLPGQAPGGGDIYVTIRIAPHSVFEVDGHNLLRSVKIPLSVAVLGGTVGVETPAGNVEMKIPPGIQGGQKLRLRGKGLPRREGEGNGDLYVRVEIAVPKHLTERQKELWEELAKTER